MVHNRERSQQLQTPPPTLWYPQTRLLQPLYDMYVFSSSSSFLFFPLLYSLLSCTYISTGSNATTLILMPLLMTTAFHVGNKPTPSRFGTVMGTIYNLGWVAVGNATSSGRSRLQLSEQVYASITILLLLYYLYYIEGTHLA